MIALNADDEAVARARNWEAWRPVSTIAHPAPKVAPDCERATLEAIFRPEAIDAVLVVDGDGRAVGMILRTAMTQPGPTARELMVQPRVVLDESLPISVAAALLASAPCNLAPVVSTRSGVIGLVSARDFLRWVALQAGHRVSDRAAAPEEMKPGKDGK